jgi:hypothetical protein
MNKAVGLWIDHTRAVIVTLENDTEKTQEISSNIENQLLHANETALISSSDAQTSAAEHVQEKQLGKHLGKYYAAIILNIRDAESIWIFGPDLAKVELENRLKHDELGARVVGIETADQMTYQQIAAKVHAHYSSGYLIQD